jgi:hypothetical protein
MKLSKESLSKLTKEEKLKLFSLLEEKQKRDKAKRPPFHPHAGQLRVIKSRALERFLFCGNGFGKSAVLVNEVHWAATGFNPITGENGEVPAKICLVLDTPEKIEEFVREYRQWHHLEDDQLHKRGKAYWCSITYDNGSTVTVLTHEVSDLKPEGSQWTHIFADEPPPQWLFTALFRGGRIKGKPVKVLMAGTPVKAAWLRTEVWEPWVDGTTPWVECFTGDTDENASNLEDSWMERFFSKLSPKEQQIRRKGMFFDIEGLALAHLFKPAKHIVDDDMPWERSNPCVVVFDPAPAKAHVAVLLGVDENNTIYVIDEHQEKANARAFAKNVIALGWFHSYRVTDILYDSLGNSENLMGESYKSFSTILNEELRAAGIGRARATTFDEKDDEDFVERIREVLVVVGDEEPQMKFFARCKGAISDVKSVQWYEDKQIKENKKKLDIRKKDFLACIKYALATNLFFDKPRKQRPHYTNKKPYGMETAIQRKVKEAARVAMGGKPQTKRFFKKRLKSAGRPRSDWDDD